MDGGKKDEPGGSAAEPKADTQNPPLPSQREDDEVEDGDIATPKRDLSGNDDEPL